MNLKIAGINTHFNVNNSPLGLDWCRTIDKET